MRITLQTCRESVIYPLKDFYHFLVVAALGHSSEFVDEVGERAEGFWRGSSVGLQLRVRDCLPEVSDGRLDVDVVESPAGRVLRVEEEGAKGDKYRETPIPSDLATRIATIDDVRDEASDHALVDVSKRTIRRWVDRYGEELADAHDDPGWRDLTYHDLRRTWATLLAGGGVDPLLVCDWGGWSDLQTFLEHYRGTYSPDVQRREREKVAWL